MAPFLESVLEQVKGDVTKALSPERIEQICSRTQSRVARLHTQSDHHRLCVPAAGLGGQHRL